MSENEFIKRYKEQLKNRSEKAPEGLWDHIARNLDEELVSRYQQELDLNRVPAPEGVWDHIARNLDEELISRYQQELDLNRVPAPEGIWENLERSLDAPLITNYRIELEANQEKAPADLWDKIDKNLDIDEVWHRVTYALDAYKNRSSVWFNVARAAAVIGIVSTLGIGAWFAIERLQQPHLAIREVQQDQVPNQQEGRENRLPDDGIVDDSMEPQRILPGIALVDPQINISPPILTSEEPQQGTSFPDNASLNRITPMQASLGYHHARHLQKELPVLAGLPVRELPDELFKDVQPPQIAWDVMMADSRKLSFGFSAGIKNTWLFSNETFLGLAGYNGHRTQISIFPDFAFALRYRFRPQWGVEAGFSSSSTVGQSFYQYIHGRFSRREIALNYIQGEILANYMSKRSWILGQNTIRLNSTIGLYFSGLNNAFESIEGERFNVTRNYRNLDYGLILGQNIDIELSGNFTLSPGLRLTWGLPNIHERVPEKPEFMWRTLNRSLEFRVAVLYRLHRQGQ